jgi:hypothetical protein
MARACGTSLTTYPYAGGRQQARYAQSTAMHVVRQCGFAPQDAEGGSEAPCCCGAVLAVSVMTAQQLSDMHTC